MIQDLLTLIQSSTFYEFAAILTLAALAGIIGTILRQPLIIAFIAIGIIAGPSVLGIVTDGGEIALLSKLGISILLFIVGLKLDLSLIKNLGTVAMTIGSVQIITTIGLSFAICMMLGITTDMAVLISIALAFSSTIIIVKLLSDKKEIDSLHGQIALGVLIIQDLVVVVSMMVLATLGGAESGDNGVSITEALLQVAMYAVILLVLVGLFMKFAALTVVSYMAKLPELLLCFAIAWAVMLAALCDMLGLSKELGGLMAGVSLASTPYREAIISRLASLRDFLLLFFFIALGTQIDLALLGGQIIPALILSVFVMLFKPLIIMTMAGVLGYRKRTSFLAGLSLGQISEFSLIFIAMAASLGMADQETLGLVTMVALITIGISTYLLSLSHMICAWVDPYIDIFERSSVGEEQKQSSKKTDRSYDIILFGLGRYGQAMARRFMDQGKTILAVDFNPDAVKDWRARGHDALFGDASDPEFFHSLPLKKSHWVVSALPQFDFGITHEDPRLIMLDALKREKFTGKIALACHKPERVENFKQNGVHVVFLPFHDAAGRAVDMVNEFEEREEKGQMH